MPAHRRLVAVLALAGLTTTGCSAPTGSHGPAADAALEWVEHLCSGRYTDAHELTAAKARIDTDAYQGMPAFLAEADQFAADRLEALEAEGTEISPDLVVDEVRADDTPIAVSLTGSCWGEPFRESVEVLEEDDEWRMARGLPAWPTPILFDFPGYTSFAQLDIEHGMSVPSTDSDAALWLLPPGRHSVEVPAHFLTGEASHTEVVVSGLRLTEPGTLPEISTAQITAAFDDLVTTCGDLCVLTVGPPEQAVPATIEPVTGSEVRESHGAVLIRPTGRQPGLFDARPESWGKQSPDTGIALLSEVALEHTVLSCPEEGACTVTVADEVDGLDTVRGLQFVDADGEVAVSALL